MFVIEEAKETIKTSNKYGTEVTLNLVSNVIGDSNGEANFWHNLSLTDRHVARLSKTFVNNSTANVKLKFVPFIWISEIIRKKNCRK